MATANDNVRWGDTTNYDVVGHLALRETPQIAGRTAAGTSWHIQLTGRATPGYRGQRTIDKKALQRLIFPNPQGVTTGGFWVLCVCQFCHRPATGSCTASRIAALATDTQRPGCERPSYTTLCCLASPVCLRAILTGASAA